MEELGSQSHGIEDKRQESTERSCAQPNQVERCKLTMSLFIRLITSLNVTLFTRTVRWLHNVLRHSFGALISAVGHAAEKSTGNGQVTKAPGNSSFAIIHVCHHLIVRSHYTLPRPVVDEQPSVASSEPADGSQEINVSHCAKTEANNNSSKSGEEQTLPECVGDEKFVREEDPDIIDSLVSEPIDLANQSTPLFPPNGTWAFDELEKKLEEIGGLGNLNISLRYDLLR